MGKWLNDRSPEFDEILFWKLDRFVRRLSDLATMIEWSLKRGKNLVSKNDDLDLTTAAGRTMVTIIGGIAEIEAANTSTRVTSLWDYAKSQEGWLVGKPTYGYVTVEDDTGKIVLAVDPEACEALHWARRMAVRGRSARFIVRCLKRSGLMGQGLTVATLLRRLRNPALLGYRVEEDREGGQRRSKPVLGQEGKPIKVAPAIFTEEEFETLGAALDKRMKKQPPRRPGGATRFLGVLVCADCKTNMTVHITRNRSGVYPYLRCRNCRSGGYGAPHPDQVYERLVEDVLKILGDCPVQVRHYAEGADGRREIKRLQEHIAVYMRELGPEGRYSKTRFTKARAEAALDKLIAELEAIDPETAQDRWIRVPDGKTFRERWQEGGMGAMSADLHRVGIRCEVTRTKVSGVRAPTVRLRLLIPEDVRERLVIHGDDFAPAL
ncbi:recombinase family protein [Streptomyces sp. NPDC097595]|uniref:recombinase family protein n=1 Tax=Streptomyces sp. NPDC097595 TaxID=3366090 RepID=UPI003812C614